LRFKTVGVASGGNANEAQHQNRYLLKSKKGKQNEKFNDVIYGTKDARFNALRYSNRTGNYWCRNYRCNFINQKPQKRET